MKIILPHRFQLLTATPRPAFVFWNGVVCGASRSYQL
jgi:hypothetical protein